MTPPIPRPERCPTCLRFVKELVATSTRVPVEAYMGATGSHVYVEIANVPFVCPGCLSKALRKAYESRKGASPYARQTRTA